MGRSFIWFCALCTIIFTARLALVYYGQEAEGNGRGGKQLLSSAWASLLGEAGPTGASEAVTSGGLLSARGEAAAVVHTRAPRQAAPYSRRRRQRKLSEADAELHIKTKLRYRERKRRRRPGGCWSQREQHLFYKHMPMSEALDQALRKYEDMHQRCTNVTDWRAYTDLLFWDKLDQRGPQNGCQYLIYSDPLGHGLGNRIINLVSTFALALVTNRAIIMKADSILIDFLCNPFKFSTWALPLDKWKAFIDNVWKDVRRMNGIAPGNVFEGWKDRRLVHVGINWNSQEAASKFFCPEFHKNVFSRIPVMSLESDEWFVPGLYFIPEFDAELQRLFPDGRVFTYLSRYLVHPTNRLWLTVTRFYDAHLAHHTRLVGIQVRKFWPCDDPVDARVMDCAFNVSGAIPPAVNTTEYLNSLAQYGESRTLRNRGARESIGVFMASLNRTFSDILADYVVERVLEGGQLIGVYTLSHEGHEKHEIAQYEMALVEMLLLSMCDELLTTDFSTFGYVAAGLSGVLPYSMNIVVHGGGDFRTNGRPVCQVISSEPCFHQFPSKKLQCAEEAVALTEVNLDVDVCDGVGVGLAHKIQRKGILD